MAFLSSYPPSPKPGTQAGKPKITSCSVPPGLVPSALGACVPTVIPGRGPDDIQGPCGSRVYSPVRPVPWGPLPGGRETEASMRLPSRTLAGPQVPVLSGSYSSGLHAPGGSPSGSNTSHIWDTQRVSPQCVSCWEKPRGVETE